MPPEEDKQDFTADDLAHLREEEGEEDAAKGAEGGDTGEDTKAPGDGAGAETDEGKKGEGDNPADYLPPDWRDKEVARLGLTGDAQKKALEIAKRATTPAELLRRVMSAASKITEVSQQLKDRVKLPSGKKDDPKDVEAFKKAWGVPDAPEKYALPEPPAELGERSDVDKEIIGEALKDFHAAHYSQRQVDAALKAFDRAQMVVKRQMEERAAKMDDEADETLRSQYLREYKPNVELANRLLSESLGKYMSDKSERADFLNMRLQDGTRIGNYVPFVNWIIDLAKNGADPIGDDSIIEGEMQGGDSLQKRKDEIMGLMHTDEDAYKKAQPELEKIITALNRQKARAK